MLELFTDAVFNVGVQLNLIDISSSGREDTALATSANSSTIEETVSSVLGHKFLVSLCDVRISLDDLLKREENVYNWEISGLITKNPRDEPEKRNVNYYCINGRVVDLPKITSLLKKLWGGFGGKKKPSCILNLTLPNDAFDINLSPDKQHVLLTHEQEICLLVEGVVTKLWASHTQGVFELQELEAPVEDEVDDDEDAEKQKHKRRFAFVHDLAGAKLQHHSEARQRNQSVEESKRVDAEAMHSRGDANEKSAGPKEKRAKTEVNNESARADKESTELEISQIRSSDPISIDSISDMERRKWTAVRSRFNSADSPMEAAATPVTPDSPSKLEGYVHQPSRRVSGASTDLDRVNPPRREKPMESLQSRKQTLMEQFAFPSTREVSATADTVVKQHVLDRDESRSLKNHRGLDEDNGASSGEASGPYVPEESDLVNDVNVPSTGDNQEISTTAQIDSQSPATMATSTDLPRGRSDTRGKEADAIVPATVETISHPVIWDRFTSTEDVCRASRLERLHMMKRKMDLKGGQPDSPEARSSDITDVTQSVGTSNAKSAKINLSKEQFRGGMAIVGQFNMGFILARCQKNHLWILDQHACDEKYNFEKLCRDTVIHEQKLLHPMALDLSPAEESCILDHMEIFEANGFRFHFDASARIRHRLSLTALPHSGARDGRKAVQFNKDDVSTLCSILMDGASYDAGDGGTGTDGNGRFGNNAVRRYASTAPTQGDNSERIIARLPKAIAMFASRACRSSIMIGTALSQKEMERIVSRLADVEHPWNCPHGRPTMRHVGEVLSTFKRDERKAAEYISGPTITMAQMTQEVEDDEQSGALKEPFYPTSIESGQA